ncbi:alpha/beta hydrolase [Sphingomonas sp. PAMC 26621]|uniref:alpha/beta hydrolase n=1 Tax=Sphingomonas sp. PAMC 26621 TaxID=1112213 RepID=UPI001EE64178|nr:alpha/beta hydrolase [Sphingomonas sp. PAMC 26621]
MTVPGVVASPVTLTATDGVRIDGDYRRATSPRALILLFHQAGSGKGEYATIAPRLAAAGYSSLAIDQRAGGPLFGVNATAARLGRPADYPEAQRDLEAALAWGRAQGLPIILWGSSYSAALVFRVAAAHPQGVAAVLAFSPGEYLDDKQAVAHAAAAVRVPVFVTSADDAGEIAAARAILAASPAALKRQYLPRAGVHGSSTLIPAKNAAGAAANWAAVLDFLHRVGGPTTPS